MRIRRRSIGLLSFVLTAGIFLLVGLTFLPETEKEIPDSPSLVFLEKAKAEPTLLSERQMSEKDTLPSSETVPSYVLEEFETILQLPELPTGCEITAMTMALRYYGFSADKVEMATEYLPTAAANLYYGDDGRLYGPDLNRYFVGRSHYPSGVYLWDRSDCDGRKCISYRSGKLPSGSGSNRRFFGRSIPICS